jgi:acyl-phosphate glycerol 3-phosphate acyltransferase
MTILLHALIVVIAYVIGSINISIIVSKKLGKDIRESGSGSAGATNMARSFGLLFGIVSLVFDTAKGVLAIFIATQISPGEISMYLAAVAVMIGHAYPVFFKFKGGKCVATALGIVLYLEPFIALIAIAAFAITMSISLYVSLGSIVAAITYVVGVSVKAALTESLGALGIICAIIIATILILRHQPNIRRLLKKEEPRFKFKK